MVFLTSIDILDTGFLTRSNRSGQVPTTNRVNAGQSLRLKGVELDLNGKSNIDKEPFAGNLTGEISCPLISVDPDEFSLTLYINSNNVDGNNVWGINDVANIVHLRRLTKTPGFKAIYYPVIDGGDSQDLRRAQQQLIYAIGRPDTTEPQGDISIPFLNGNTNQITGNLTQVRYVAVRFETFNIKQEPNSSKIEVRLTGVIIA